MSHRLVSKLSELHPLQSIHHWCLSRAFKCNLHILHCLTTEKGFKFIEPAPNRHFSIIGKVWGRGNLFEMIFWCNLSNYTEEEEKWIKDWLFKVECSSMPCTGWRHTHATPQTLRHPPSPPLLSSSPLYLFGLPLISTMLFLSGFYSSRTAA